MTILNIVTNTTILASRTTVDIPEEIKLNDIFIPTFVDFSSIAGSASTVFSFVSFLGSIATIGLVIFWIVKIIRLGIEGIQTEGKPDKIQEVTKKLQSVFFGVFMSFLFPVILSIIGIFAGVGNIFEWPRMFRACNSPEYDYYFQAYLAQDGSNATEVADSICNYDYNTSNFESN